MNVKLYLARKKRKILNFSKSRRAHRTIKSRLSGKKRCLPHLKPIFDNTGNIKAGNKLLLTMGKNEAARIPYFLEYYTKLGIDHFFFIDNDSDIPMEDQLKGMPNVSLWHTTDSYKESQFGVDWMNVINGSYGIGHWVLTVDLDEFLVFPEMEHRTYNELLVFLDTIEQNSMFAPLVDMYPDGPISEASVPEGQSPLNYAPCFDNSGFHAITGGYEDVWLRGGPRCRVFNNGDIEKSPTLSKTPLIKWTRETLYLFSTHSAYPPEHNHIYQTGIQSPTGALLHFKFVSEIKEKAKYAVLNENHYEGSREYKMYLEALEKNEQLNLYSQCSSYYKDSESLVEAGLMGKGLWGSKL